MSSVRRTMASVHTLPLVMSNISRRAGAYNSRFSYRNR